MVKENHKPVLIVIAGPNGSGKTTITSKILKHEWLENALYINPDQVAQDRFGDWNSPEAVLQAVQYCEEQREECLQQGQSCNRAKASFSRRCSPVTARWTSSVAPTRPATSSASSSCPPHILLSMPHALPSE